MEWEWGGRSRFYNSGNTGKRIQKQDEVVGGKGKEFKQNCSEENKTNLQIKGTLNKWISGNQKEDGEGCIHACNPDTHHLN